MAVSRLDVPALQQARAFSTVYKRQLTLENVTGVQIEDKHKAEKVTVPSVSTTLIEAIPEATLR
jgi:hypothetical protein